MTPQHEDTILQQLTVDFGPSHLFSRFFLTAIQHVRKHDITFRMASFAELEEVNSRNGESWRTLFSSFRPGVGGADEDNGFVVFGVDGAGEVIATQAIRLFDWRDTNLKAEAESLRFFYADPDASSGPGEACIVTAPEASDVTGLVGLGGAVWFHPDHRRTGAFKILPRLVRAHAVARYNVDAIIALFAPENVAKGVHTRAGYRYATDSLIMRNSPTLPDGDLTMTLCIQSPMETVDDVFDWLVENTQPRLEVEAGVEGRRAQQLPGTRL